MLKTVTTKVLKRVPNKLLYICIIVNVSGRQIPTVWKFINASYSHDTMLKTSLYVHSRTNYIYY